MKIEYSDEFKKDAAKLGLGDYGYTPKWWEPVWWGFSGRLGEIFSIPKRIKWFIQRGTRGYADCDTWSLDSYIAGWLPSALRQFADEAFSHPIGTPMGKWKKTLRDIATNLEKAHDYLDLAKDYSPKKATKAKNKALTLLKKHWFDLWW